MAAFGMRLMPQVLDHHAIATPARLYASIPKNGDLSQGFQDVTCEDMAQCVNFMAFWVVKQFGCSDTFETLSYIGIPDLRSVAVFLGAVKAGYKVLLPSPRNPPATNLSLMEQTSCSKILYAAEAGPVVNQIVTENELLTAWQIPSFLEMFGGSSESFPYVHEFKKAKDFPIVVLHSSGSTGLPKPITMTHATFAVLDNERNLPTVPGRRNRDYSIWNFKDGGRFYTVFPYFHLAGFLSLLVNPIFTDLSSPVLGPPLMPPSGALLKEVMKHQKLRALYLPPSIAEQLLQEPNGIAFFKDLEFLCYTGGPFSEHAGKQLSNVTELCPLYGCTEAFQVPQLAPAAPEDWAWMEWNPHFKVEMQPSSDEDGTFELVLFADSSTSNISALNHNLPGVAEYHTKDLFKQHPKKVGLWQYYGRRDDIVVLSNGEKFNPVPMELLIQGHSALSGVLVVGMGRTQSALIIESKLELNNDEKASLVNEVWPMVERANRLVPAQGRIVPGMLLFSNPEKPFIRAGKGTIVRKLTERLYQAEIDRLYTVEKDSVGPRPPTIRPTLKLVFEAEAISEFVCKIVLEVLPEILELKDGDDLFSSGLDSVKVNQLINLLKTAMNENGKGKDVSWMNTRVIFQHRTVEKLSSVLYDFLNAGKIPIDAVDLSRTTEMQNLLERYTAEIREERSETMPLGDVSTIALIGSTGYLGPHIVASLLRHPGLSTIYCLNRGTDAQVRTNNALQGLEGVWSKEPHKLQFLTIDLGAPHFGLDDATYSTVSMTVDVIIFNSWNPNFSLPIQSFEKPFLQGLKTTIDWGISSVRKPGIVFVSSIAAVGNWTKVHPEQGLIPEEPAKEHNVALHMGYGESKCVAEQMLTRANERSGIPVAILRAGQIGGTTSPHLGTWPIQGWLFNLIKASTELHVFPAHVSPVDWIPVDTFATGILYAVYKIRSHDTLRVYNLVHPNPLPWSFFFNTLRTQFGLEADEVSLSTWLDKLDQVGGSKVDRAKLRSLKMYDFLRSLDQGREEDMQCQSENAAEASAGPPPLTEGLLTTWLSAWNLKSNRWMVKI